MTAGSGRGQMRECWDSPGMGPSLDAAPVQGPPGLALGPGGLGPSAWSLGPGAWGLGTWGLDAAPTSLGPGAWGLGDSHGQYGRCFD